MPRQQQRRTRGKGEGSIYQQADGWWVGSVERPRRPDGRRRRARILRRRRQDVVDEIAALKARAAGDNTINGTQTVAEYLDFWLTEVAAGEITANSLTTYTAHVDRIRPHIGAVRVDRLTKAHVQVLANKLAADFAPKTRQVTLSALRRAIEWGVPDYFPTNPARGVRGPRQVTAKIDDALTADESRAVLTAAVGDRYYALYYLALKYGLRIGELLGLRWADIDLDSGELTVERAKTVAGERTLPLIDEAATVIATHRARWLGDRHSCSGTRTDLGYELAPTNVVPLRHIGQGPDDPVFPAPESGQLKAQRVRSWFSDLCDQAGIPHLCRNCRSDKPCSSNTRRFHSSRHTAATLLLEAGVPLEVVSAILGHSNISITADTYAKVRADLMRKGLKTLG